MSKKVIAVALDINKIPYVNDPEIIFTPGRQKIWYTANTQSIEIPKHIKLVDNLLNQLFEKFHKKPFQRDLATFNYFTKCVTRYLKTHPYDEIVFENNQLRDKILPNLQNKNEYVVKNNKKLETQL